MYFRKLFFLFLSWYCCHLSRFELYDKRWVLRLFFLFLVDLIYWEIFKMQRFFLSLRWMDKLNLSPVFFHSAFLLLLTAFSISSLAVFIGYWMTSPRQKWKYSSAHSAIDRDFMRFQFTSVKKRRLNLRSELIQHTRLSIVLISDSTIIIVNFNSDKAGLNNYSYFLIINHLSLSIIFFDFIFMLYNDNSALRKKL